MSLKRIAVMAGGQAIMIQLRKLIHTGGALFVPVACYDRYLALALAILGLLLFALLEAQKRRLAPALGGLVYRERELKGVASEPLAYLLVIISLLALSFAWAPTACYTGIIVLTVGDGIASLAGRAFGRHKLPYSEKTWEGTLFGFIAAALVGFPFAGPLAIAGAAAGMAVEAYSRRFENVSVAASAFVVMALLFLAL